MTNSINKKFFISVTRLINKVLTFFSFKTLLFKIKSFSKSLLPQVCFMILLLLYVIGKIWTSIMESKFFPKRIKDRWIQPFNKIQTKAFTYFDLHDPKSISRVSLIDLAFQNMKAKKVRTLITVGGMSIGIGAIVFLVSVGYGLEQLVVSRVARLDEMKQVEVMTQTGGIAKINDKTLSDFSGITNVSTVLPLIAVVGRVSYQNSVSDMAVYGVTTEYLKQSAIKPVQGKIFDSNDLVTQVIEPKGQVAGATTERNYASVGEKIQDIKYSLPEGTWIRVRENPDVNSNIIGYTKRVEGDPSGEEIWGTQYASDNNNGDSGLDTNNQVLGKWVKANLPIWNKEVCITEENPDCVDNKYTISRDSSGLQERKTGYFAQLADTKVTSGIVEAPQVLGLSTDSTVSGETVMDGSVDWVKIASESGEAIVSDTTKVDLNPLAIKKAVVNRAMIKILGLKEADAVGQSFSVSFVVVGDLLNDKAQNIESNPTEYTIVGVVPGEQSPVFYVPFVDLRSLGVTNYSQIKLIAKDQTSLTKVRQQIETLGYTTSSVVDTVSQITSLFGTIRVVLGILGMVALAVASLGMLNTLTVSLLERTREVGLMKAMGMKSSEVSELFLTESMMMGFMGGMFGILLGFLAGKILGILLSALAIFKGVGFIDVTYLPFTFVLTIIIFSFIVGVVTGIYPARRATKISALNALRYE